MATDMIKKIAEKGKKPPKAPAKKGKKKGFTSAAELRAHFTKTFGK
jgi:hypothetical protein